MTLMRFDPFRELDRLAEQTMSVGARLPRLPARQEGDEVLIDERPHGEFAHAVAESAPVPAEPARG